MTIHYEEELDLFFSCISANISIMLYKTIDEINTLLLRTQFKPPSSVSNNFLLRSNVEFGRLLLSKLLFYRYTNEHTKPYSIIIVCLLSYMIYSGCCHVYFCCDVTNRLSVLKLPGIQCSA